MKRRAVQREKIGSWCSKGLFFWVVTSVVLEKYGKKGWAISAVSVLIPQNGDYFYTWIFSQAAFEKNGEIHGTNLTILILRFKNVSSKGQLFLSLS